MADKHFEITGYQNVFGDRFEGRPSDDLLHPPGEHPMSSVDGVLVHTWVEGDRDSDEWHWIYQGRQWTDWEYIYDDIAEGLAQYGIGLE